MFEIMYRKNSLFEIMLIKIVILNFSAWFSCGLEKNYFFITLVI